MVAAQQLQPNPLSAAEDLRKHVIRLMQNTGEETHSNVLVLPQVFLEFLDYDHKMALFLNHLLYWQSRTRHPDRWVYKSHRDLFNELGFKESVIRRLLHGDPKTKRRKRILSEIGVEVKVKRAPNGSPTNHFRIDLDVFLGAIRQFLAKKQAGIAIPDSVESTETNLRESQIGKDGFHTMDQPESAGTLDQEITSQTFSEETSSESSDLDDDLQIFAPYRKRFGKLKAELHDPFRQQITRLGRERVGQVLERCATRGRSWNYALRALENEAEPPAEAPTDARWDGFTGLFYGNERQSLSEQPIAASLPVSDRLQAPLKKGTALQMWEAALYQMNAQLGDDFRNRARGLTLIDFEANTFVVAAKTAFMRDELQGRLARTVNRILRDVCGPQLALQVLLEDEWVGRYSAAGIALSA